ncbi:BQ5605_C001g00505 [Microbotryum silenes-dioicae]|uniref:BQ5605_C001g00505 protein n=1 Tax=Microbotryum silenes-dioicae TaxID=796604 RepID=A0A2X0P605_9BASI|nr:BQ5605_C001g00505 [Microbotryum silenes-dioicae]
MASEVTPPLIVPATRALASSSTPPHAIDTRPSTSSAIALRALQASIVVDITVNLVYGTRTRLWIIWSLALARIVTVVVLIVLHTRGRSAGASHTPSQLHTPRRSHHHHHSSRHRIHWIGIHVLVALLACLWYLNELVQRQILFPTRHVALDLSALVKQFVHVPRAFYPSLSLGFALIEYVAFIFVNRPQLALSSTPRTRRATFGSVNAEALSRPRLRTDSPHQPDSELFADDYADSDVENYATETDTNPDTETETDTEAEVDENEIIDVPKRDNAGGTTGASLRSRASRASFFASAAAENGTIPRAAEEDVGSDLAVRNRSVSTSSQAFRLSQNYGALSQTNRSFGEFARLDGGF